MKTLFIGLNWLGDVIMSFPAISLAQEHFRGDIDVLTRPNLTELYRLHQGIKTVWPIDTRRFWGFHLTEYLRVRKAGYARIIVLPRSFRSAFTAFLCGGSDRIGYRGERREWLLHQAPALPTQVEQVHESLLHGNLVKAHDFSGPRPTWESTRFPVEEQIWIARKFHLDPHEKYIILAPGAAFGEAKRWEGKRFSHLAQRLVQETGMTIISTGSEGEKPLTRLATEFLGSKGHDLGGKTTLRELMGLISLSRLVVANDSGTMHLGAILGKPVVVPVGSTDMTRTGPLTSLAFFVFGDGCHPPCRKRICPRGDHKCMESIPVEAMFEATMKALNHA